MTTGISISSPRPPRLLPPTHSLCPPVPTVLRLPSRSPFSDLSDQPRAFGRQSKTKGALLPTVKQMQCKQTQHILHSPVPHHSGDPRKRSVQQGGTQSDLGGTGHSARLVVRDLQSERCAGPSLLRTHVGQEASGWHRTNSCLGYPRNKDAGALRPKHE